MKIKRIFVDMDGTLAEWKSSSTMEDLYEKDYFFNLQPHIELINAINQICLLPEYDIYISSTYFTDSKYAEKEKRLWIPKYLPYITPKNIILMPVGSNKAKFVPEGIRHDDVLIDDYTNNLFDWTEAGGQAVKFMNGINHTKKRWQGKKIYLNEENKTLFNQITDILFHLEKTE